MTGSLTAVPELSGLRPKHVAPRPLSGVAALDRTARTLPPEVASDVEVTGVSLSSDIVQPGDLYAALPGARAHGAQFAPRAADRGATAVLTDAAGEELAVSAGLPVVVVDDVRKALGRVSSWVYGEPSRELLMLGVTGTNGKTTTSYLLAAVLEQAYGDSGLIGTVETRVGGERFKSVRTTPEAPDLQALLAVMVEHGLRACAMEVSSHALALGRAEGIVYDVVGFTNLSQDHLDFHSDMEDYYASKARLFTPAYARRGVICVDDDYGRRLANESQVPITTLTTRDDVEADWRVHDREVSGSGARTEFSLTHRDGTTYRPTSPMAGDFNVANAALTTLMAVQAGIDVQLVLHGLAHASGPPGRMEPVRSTHADARLAIVDYAHTPDAVRTALEALRATTRGRVIAVLGAGGDRDPGKRPLMGAEAARHADVVVVTDDNPRSEPPEQIRAAVLAGAQGVADDLRAEVREVGDRHAAIRAAVEVARPGDTVIVLGKGHELGQEVAGVVHPFDDRIELRAALDDDRAGAAG